VLQIIALLLWPTVYFFVGGANFYGQIYLPFVFSLIGIWFYLQVSSVLSKLGDNRVIHLIGTNTYSIMLHQQTVVWLINSVFAILMVNGFNFQQYRTTINYVYTSAGAPFLPFVYMALALIVPSVLAYLYGKTVVTRMRVFFHESRFYSKQRP
jgi:hypothetical protein